MTENVDEPPNDSASRPRPEGPVEAADAGGSVPGGPATLRCGFCLTLNRVDVARAGERPGCGSCGRPFLLDRPIQVQEEDFRRTVLGAGIPVLVDFYADWCGPCKMVAPVVDEIAREASGRLLVAKVDTDRAPGLAKKLGIRGVPTLILFRDGEEVERSAGFEPERLRAMTGTG